MAGLLHLARPGVLLIHHDTPFITTFCRQLLSVTVQPEKENFLRVVLIHTGMKQNASKLFLLLLIFFFYIFWFLYIALAYIYKENQHEIQSLQYLADLFDLLFKALSRDVTCRDWICTLNSQQCYLFAIYIIISVQFSVNSLFYERDIVTIFLVLVRLPEITWEYICIY